MNLFSYCQNFVIEKGHEIITTKAYGNRMFDCIVVSHFTQVLPGHSQSLQRAQGSHLGGFGEHQLALSPSGARRWLVQSPLNCQNPLADGDSGLWVCHLPVDTAEVKGTEPVGSSDVVEVYRRYAAAGKSR